MTRLLPLMLVGISLPAQTPDAAETDIVTRVAGVNVDVAVIVSTLRALRHHGRGGDGSTAPSPDGPDPEAVRAGLANLAKHIENVRTLGLRPVVTLNLFEGDGDEEALEKAVLSSATHVAFVASKVKAAKILEFLKDRAVSPARLSQVRAPAGLDIHASSPEEIAVSVLAEIVQLNGTRMAAAKAKKELPVAALEARDPICGMAVDVSSAKYKSEFHRNSYYFCCAGCKQQFDKQPEKYVLAAVR